MNGSKNIKKKDQTKHYKSKSNTNSEKLKVKLKILKDLTERQPGTDAVLKRYWGYKLKILLKLELNVLNNRSVVRSKKSRTTPEVENVQFYFHRNAE